MLTQNFVPDGNEIMAKIRLTLTVAALTLLGAGCSTQLRSGVNAATPAPSAAISYQCESGAHVRARYPDADSAVIEYRGQVHRLRIAVSASGVRYVGDGIEWWTKGTGKGSVAVVFEHEADGRSGRLIEQCSAE